jgi:hypothetical protein
MSTFVICLIVLSALNILLPAATQAESIVKIMEAPFTYHSYGLTWDGEHLWVGDDADGWVAQVDTSDGSIMKTIMGAPSSNHGLAWDGTHLWVSGDYHTDWIYRIAPDGTRLDSIINPGGDYSGGMTWDGGYLWVSRYYPNSQPNLFQVDVSTGTVMDTIPSQGLQPQGLAWDGAYLWNVQDDNDDDPELVYQIDPATGDTLLSFPVPDTGNASGESPRGLAWDGQYLWLVSRAPGSPLRNNLYKIDPFGGGVPEMWLSDTEHDYGHTVIGSPGDWTLGIRNEGTATLLVDSIPSSSAYFTPAGPFPKSVPAGDTLYVPVTFSPDTWGEFLGTLTVYSNDPVGVPPEVDLTGWGVWPDQEIGPLPASHDFGMVRAGGSKRWVLTIQNEGAQTLHIYSASMSTPYFDTDEVEFSVFVDSTESFDLGIWFLPADGVPYLDTLVITTNDADEPVIEIELSGTGDASPHQAGSILWSYQAAGGYSNKVTSIRSIPDINGDGFDDCIATAENYTTYCISGNSSGLADILWTFKTDTDIWRTGSVWQDFSMSPVPDLDGDGRYDVVIGTAGGSRSVIAISGIDGDMIWTYDSHEYGDGGWIDEVATIDDIDGDGVIDILAAAEDDGNDTGPRRAYCLSGATGDKIWDHMLFNSVFCVRAIDDLNDDGKDEVAAGTTGGFVYILNGANGGIIDSYDAGSTVWSVAALDDITGDGKKDIVAGTHDGRVHVVRSDSASLAWPAPLSVGGIITEVHTVGDQTGDGVDEITVAGTMSNHLLINGATGSSIWSRPTGHMGFATSPTPDLTGDGLDDVVGGSGYSVNRVRAIEGSTGDTLWMRSTVGPVETVSYIASIDGDAWPEILAGTREGEIICYAGGGGTAGIADGTGSAEDRNTRVSTTIWNCPNPCRPETDILFRLRSETETKVAIYDIHGRLVKVLSEGLLPAGEHSTHWDGRDRTGAPVAAGIYFADLQTGKEVLSRKIILMR